MALYYGTHKVVDYDAWRPYFDNDDAQREALGTKVISVMRSAHDPNEVHFIFDVADLGKFGAFMQNPEMAAMMQKAGVLEQPVIYKMETL